MKKIYLAFLLPLILLFTGCGSEDEAKAVKKDELIQNYRVELLEILEKYEDNKELQFQERIKFLKRVNSELSMNIFFEKEEARNLIQELSNLGK